MAEGKESRAEVERVTLENFHLVVGRTALETFGQSGTSKQGFSELIANPPTSFQESQQGVYINEWAAAEADFVRQSRIIIDILLAGPDLFEPDKWPLEQSLAGTTIINLGAAAAKIEEKQVEARARAEVEKTKTQQIQTETGNE